MRTKAILKRSQLANRMRTGAIRESQYYSLDKNSNYDNVSSNIYQDITLKPDSPPELRQSRLGTTYGSLWVYYTFRLWWIDGPGSLMPYSTRDYRSTLLFEDMET